jgi:hypothetical protein
MFQEDISKYHVTYTDPENDTVFITNEIELKEALVLCPEMLVISLRRKFSDELRSYVACRSRPKEIN